ncbi:MAG: PAS domain S-box protein [Betaproteobacteria bacterium]|nr:PAS domain S-box protein [Betaproteobacteria bacterium]
MPEVDADARAALAESEARFALATAAAGIGVWDYDAQTDVVRVNPQFGRVFGLDAHELPRTGTEWRELLGAESHRERIRQDFVRLLKGELKEWDATYPGLAKDGACRWLHLHAKVVSRTEGRAAKVAGTVQDVTARREAEQLNRITRLAVEGASEAILRVDIDARIVDANEAAARLFGHTREELLRLHVPEIVPNLVLERYRDGWTRRRDEGAIVFEAMGTTKAGKEIPLEISAAYCDVESEKFVLAFVRDIAEHKRAEAALLENGARLEAEVRERTAELTRAEEELAASVARLRDFSSASADMFWEADAKGRITWASESAQRLLGVPGDTFLGKRVQEIADVGLDPGGTASSRYLAAWKERAPFRGIRFQFTGPSRNWISASGVPVFDAGGGFAGYRGTASDVTNEVRAENARQESEARFRDFAEASGDWLWEGDADGRLTWISDSVERITGIPAQWFLGKRPQDMAAEPENSSPEAWRVRQQARELHEPYRDFRYRLRLPNGELWISNSGVPRFDASGRFLGYRGTTADITERKRAEQALAENEARFRALTELSSDWYWEQDDQYRFVMFGGSRPERDAAFDWRIGKTRWDSVTVGVTEAQWAAHRAQLDARQPFRDFEYQGVSEHGETIWVSVSGDPAFGGDGRFLGYRGVGRNVTEQKSVAEALHELNRTLELRVAQRTRALVESEARERQLHRKYAAMFSTVPDAIAISRERDAVHLEVNDAWQRLMGIPRAKAIGCSSLELGLWENSAARAAALARLNTEGALANYAMRFRRPDGSMFDALVSVAKIEIEGEPCLAWCASDVSELRQAEMALRASENRLGKVINAVPHHIFAKDRDGRYLLVNRAYSEFLGITPESMLGRTPLELGIGTAETEVIASGDDKVRATGEEQFTPMQILTRPSGRRYSFAVYRIPFRYSDEIPDAVLGIAVDITELREAEENLGQTLALLESTLDSTDNAILVEDTNRRVVRWNRRALQISGVPEAELRGCDRRTLFGDRLDRFLDPAGLRERFEAIESDPEYAGTFQLRTIEGRHLECYTQPIHVDTSVAGRLWSFRDVTARERERDSSAERAAQLEAKVNERTGELTQALQDLEIFTSAVSHDLRAPLRGVNGFVAMAMEDFPGEVGPGARRYLDRALSTTRHMTAMVEGLLALARNSRAPLSRQTLDLSALARSVFDETSEANTQVIEFHAHPSPPAEADLTLMEVVLQNLIGNALKYSCERHPAVVEFGAEVRDGRTAWYVKDNGAGYDPAYADKLFQPFGRLHSAREFEGTGIGLAAVRRIVERHGGRVWAESAPDQGATFRFTLGEQESQCDATRVARSD